MAKKTITLTLYVSELVYDIQNKTYLTGRSRKTGSNHEEVANMQANDDDENADQVMRSIQNAFGTLKTKLAEWLNDDGTTSSDELMSITDKSTLEVVLNMPSNYNSSTRDAISAALHQYIVNTAIGDWFTITDKADASDYFTLSTNNLEAIREAVNKRLRPTRQSVDN